MHDLIASPYSIAALLVVVLMGCHELGYGLASRAGAADTDYQRRLDMIRNSVLALVTFLVGFSFAAAPASAYAADSSLNRALRGEAR